MHMNDNKLLNQREKIMSFIYVLLFWGITTFVCYCLIFYCNVDAKRISGKEYVVSKMERIRTFQQVQADNFIDVDTLYKKIEAYNPGVNALYEENDIKFLLNSLKDLYEKNSWDRRYKVFWHVSMFYNIWLTDKKELWAKKQNIQTFKKNLEECEIGLKNKKEEIRSNQK